MPTHEAGYDIEQNKLSGEKESTTPGRTCRVLIGKTGTSRSFVWYRSVRSGIRFGTQPSVRSLTLNQRLTPPNTL